MNTSDTQELFGASVKALRNLPGISQGTLAKRAEWHRTSISAWFPVELEHRKNTGADNEELNRGAAFYFSRALIIPACSTGTTNAD